MSYTYAGDEDGDLGWGCITVHENGGVCLSLEFSI